MKTTNTNKTYTPINKGQFTLESPERVALFEKKRGFSVENAYRENRRQWSEFPQKQYVAEYPLHVDIELSSLCNLKCPMCYTITEEFKKKVAPTRMEYDLFTRIVDECATGGVYSIRLSLRGESFLHPRIVDCIRYAKQQGIKEVSTLTNGVKLDETMFQEIMDAGIDWLTISFDGLGEIYERLRRPAKYERAVEKIMNYATIKQRTSRVKPVIKIQTILPAIQSNPNAFYDVFAPITDMVSANPLIDYTHDKSQLPKQKKFTCPQVYQRLVIGADGVVMMCANDENNDVIVGDVNTQRVYDIWHGAAMERIREIHLHHQGVEMLDPCAQCSLPLSTYQEKVIIGDRFVIAEQYVTNSQVAEAWEHRHPCRQTGQAGSRRSQAK